MKGFSFQFGKYTELRNEGVNGAPLEALLYDAVQDDKTSRAEVLFYCEAALKQCDCLPHVLQHYLLAETQRINGDSKIKSKLLLGENIVSALVTEDLLHLKIGPLISADRNLKGEPGINTRSKRLAGIGEKYKNVVNAGRFSSAKSLGHKIDRERARLKRLIAIDEVLAQFYNATLDWQLGQQLLGEINALTQNNNKN